MVEIDSSTTEHQMYLSQWIYIHKILLEINITEYIFAENRKQEAQPVTLRSPKAVNQIGNTDHNVIFISSSPWSHTEKVFC